MTRPSLYTIQAAFDDEAAGVSIRKLRHRHPALWQEAMLGAASIAVLVVATVLIAAVLP